MSETEESAADYYDSMHHQHQRLAIEAEFSLKQSIGDSEIKIHSLTTRVKDRSSYLEKVARKSYTNPAEEIEDFVGLRIVCLFTSDLPRLHEIIHSMFHVSDEENKITDAPVESFGYMSVHYICKLSPDISGPRYDDLKDIKFEIQCRTILMDAWANVSHYLAYKQGSSLPPSLRKDFHALAGLFHVADKQFEAFYNESQKSQTEAATTVANTSNADVALNRDTLMALLGSLFPDRVQFGPEYMESAAELSEELAMVNYKTIQEVATDIERGEAEARRSEEVNPPFDEIEDELTIFNAVGLARGAITASNPKYSKYRNNLARHTKY